MKLVPVRELFAMVDDCDYEMVSRFAWRKHSCGYAWAWIDGKVVLMHRLVLGNPPQRIDHKNRNKLDNQKDNLRPCAHWQNCHNRPVTKISASGLKGVELYKAKPMKKPWRAQIRVNGKRHRLGYFATAEEAAEAYRRAAKELVGEFACDD